jgi:hypothetical protein
MVGVAVSRGVMAVQHDTVGHWTEHSKVLEAAATDDADVDCVRRSLLSG